MTRPEEPGTKPERAAEPETEETDDVPEPGTPPIDEDVAGSVNAALHDADD